MSKTRFFIQDVESGECAFYAGDNIETAKKALGEFAQYAFEELEKDPDGEEHTFAVSARRMTDEEVAALPDV